MAWTTATTRATGFEVDAAVWNSEHVDNMNWLKEVNYTQFTSPVSITATTGATANTVVTMSAAHTFENVPYLIEFFSPAVQPQSTSGARCTIVLYDGSSEVEQFGYVQVPAAAAMLVPTPLQRRITPTAASHTYGIRAFTSSGTATVHAGVGGSPGTLPPGFIRVTRVPV